MKVTTCTINVGQGEANRNMALEILGFVDVFFILDCPVNFRGEYVEHENQEYEMVSTVENGDVEVNVRTSIVGWFTIESHGKESVVMKYEEEGTGKRKRIGAVYIRPLKEVMEVDKRMNEMAKCNLIIGDLNARNPIWGKEAGDNRTNAYGRQLQKWIEKENRSRLKTKEKMFRQISGLDITIYKTTDQSPKRSMTDKCGFEHMGQIISIQVEKPHNLKKDNVA